MTIQQQIDADIKSAMLAGDKAKAEVLRGAKTAMQYEAVALEVQDRTLTDEQAQKVLAKEAKKRADAAELYKNANEPERAAKEESEKQIIDTYLPEQASQADVVAAVDAAVAKLDNPQPSDMGKIIGDVRAQLGGNVEGGMVARLVKEKLANQ